MESPHPNPFLEVIRAGIPHEQHPFSFMVKARAKQGTEVEFEAAAVVMEEKTLKEPGCIAYRFHRSGERTSEYYLVEQWRDFEALLAHFATQHMADFEVVVERCLDGEIEIAWTGAPLH